MAFNRDGTLLAIASSYTFEKGELQQSTADEVYVRPVQDAEVRPKSRTSSGPSAAAGSGAVG